MELKMKRIVTALFCVLAVCAFAQQTVAPFKTQQANTVFYVNMGNTTLTTIQLTVTAACAYSTATLVDILPGSNPSDTIAGLTSACTNTRILDERVSPANNYTCASGGCTLAPYAGLGVTSFNTRTGAVTLAAADVNAVGGITNSTAGNAGTATLSANSTAVGGVSVTGTPSVGQVPVATGSAAAAWGSSPGSVLAVAGASAEYPFLDGTGTTVHDVSGNGNNATFAS